MLAAWAQVLGETLMLCAALALLLTMTVSKAVVQEGSAR